MINSHYSSSKNILQQTKNTENASISCGFNIQGVHWATARQEKAKPSLEKVS